MIIIYLSLLYTCLAQRSCCFQKVFACYIRNSKTGSQVLFDSFGEKEAISRSDGKAGTAVFCELLSEAEQFANSNIWAHSEAAALMVIFGKQL